jgi:hypothetical protein
MSTVVLSHTYRFIHTEVHINTHTHVINIISIYIQTSGNYIINSHAIHGASLHVKEGSTADFQLLLNLFTAVLLNGLEESWMCNNTAYMQWKLSSTDS